MTEQLRQFYSLGGLNAATYDIRTVTPGGEIEFYVARRRYPLGRFWSLLAVPAA